ncbi:MAG: ATP-binding protein [Thermodesulfobacteriota bacterium]
MFCFNPLFTTETQVVGFGLSTAKMIVEKHGGKIRAESPPGGGARFVMTFPRQQICEVLKTSQV